MFKVGDEVLVKAEIMDIHEGLENPYFVQADNRFINWVSEDKFIPMDKTYSDGLSDAWELADKLNNMKLADIVEVFGIDIAREEVFKEISPQEALSKIEAYEMEKEIKLGDVVEHVVGDRKTVFWVAYLGGGEITGYDKGFGRHTFTFPNRYIRKTGKHIDIESLLRQIGE